MEINPSDHYRHELLRRILANLGREEDFPSIIQSASSPVDITKIAQPLKYNNIKVAVLGAGLAGLAAAYELHKLGCEIEIFEANPTRIGGRVNTYYFREDLFGELGAMRIPVSHETTWHYINLFKLNTFPFIYETENNILDVENVSIRGLNKEREIMRYIYPHFELNNWEKRTPLNQLIQYVYNYVLLNLNREERDELLQIKSRYSDKVNYYDSLNFYQAAKGLGLSEGGMNLLNSVVGIDRGLYYNSYLEILREMYIANFSSLYRIENGTSNLPKAFYNALQGRVRFNMGHRVTGIFDNSNNKVMIKYKVNNNQFFKSFDYVLCALPFSQIRIMDINPYFTNRKMQAIRQVNYEASQKTLLLCKERFWEQKINNQRIVGGSSLTDLALTSIWYPSGVSRDNYGVLIASYNIGLDAVRIGNVNDIEIIKRELEHVQGLPNNYLDDVVEGSKTINWNNDEYALGAFAWYAPGQNQLFAYYSYLPEFNNKVFFAGEHISPYHAWMQGALQTGMVAANNIAYMLKTKR